MVRAGVVSGRVGVYCMYWTTARHKPLSLALPICTLTDGPEWLIDALTCHSTQTHEGASGSTLLARIGVNRLFI